MSENEENSGDLLVTADETAPVRHILTPEEKEAIQAKKLRKVVVSWEEDKKGKRRKIATVVEGRYQLWTEQGPGREGIRWALRSHPNSGPGVAGHGRADDLEQAIETCVENWELRQSIAADGDAQ